MAAQKARDDAETERVAAKKNLQTYEKNFRKAYENLRSLISTGKENPGITETELFQLDKAFLTEVLQTARSELQVARKMHDEKHALSEKTGLASA